MNVYTLFLLGIFENIELYPKKWFLLDRNSYLKPYICL